MNTDKNKNTRLSAEIRVQKSLFVNIQMTS